MVKKYILFCAQEANFQSRTMLIPYDEYLLCPDLMKDLDILRNESTNKIFIIDGEYYFVDNLLITNYVSENDSKTIYTAENSNHQKIVNKLTTYADGMDEGWYNRLSDKVWYDNAICNICGDFNHIKNYCKLRHLKKYQTRDIEIVEGFLALESLNGKLNYPPFDTVKELQANLYGLK